MKYRSRTEIMSAIMHTASGGGATKAELMYGAYLSYVQLRDYLDYLTGRGLLFRESGTALYKLTQKGIESTDATDRMQGMLRTDQPGNKTSPIQ